MSDYKDYFKSHYNYNFSKKDIDDYSNWFYAQWNFINNKVPIHADDNILEIGSGIGGFYSFLNKSNKKKYLGLELDKNAVDFANRFFETKVFKNESITDFNNTNTYNIVFAFEVLEHLDYPKQEIEKIHLLLKKNGYFCGTSPYPFKKNIFADKTHVYVLHPENWKRIFFEAGFRSVQTFPMSFLPFVWRINKYLNPRMPMYVPFNYFISTCLIIAKK